MSKKNHYIDNKEFYAAIIEHKKKVREAEASGESIPPVTEYIGKCFLDIATGLSFRPNFINYTYKDDMISDGIENCLQYCHNFNEEKSKNPFAYFTQIIYYAFIRRIEKEKKQSYIKQKMTEKAGIMQQLSELGEQDLEDYKSIIDFNFDQTMIDEFEKRLAEKKKCRKKKKKNNLEKFLT